MTALITQSNYIPWKGYFDNIAQSQVFVIYDDMQYTKRDWRNRNKIKTPNGLKWLTIPVEVKGKFFQKINETQTSDREWNKKHLNIICSHYQKAKCFVDEKDWLEELYLNAPTKWLTEINRYFIERINQKLGINTPIRDSREFELQGDKTEKLVNLCLDLNASQYLTGPAAKAYMDEELFAKNGIEVIYSEYSNYKNYQQLYPPFEHGVTVLDIILNEGVEAGRYIGSPQNAKKQDTIH